MPPISEGEKVFPDLPSQVRNLSLRACLRRFLLEKRNDLYNELGKNNYHRLARPLKEFVETDREYAFYLFENIKPDGRAKNELMTHGEWTKLKEERRTRIETLAARTIFRESSEGPLAGTAEKLVYGE